VVAGVVRRLAPEPGARGWALAAAAAYGLQPTALSGAVLMDWDNTVLTLATAAFFGWWAVHGPPATVRGAMEAASLLAAMLLAKESALASTVPLVLLDLWARRAGRRGWAWSLAALAAGAALAAAVYGAYCRATGWPFEAPFAHNRLHLMGFLSWPPGFDWLVLRARFAATWVFWVGPAAALLLLWPVGPALRSLLPRARPADGAGSLLLAGSVMTAAYLVINGAAWWYPRYTTPALPLLVAGAVAWAARRGSAAGTWVVGLAAAAATAAAGDLAYLSLGGLKRAVLEGAPAPVSWRLTLGGAATLAPLVLWRLWPGRPSMGSALPALLIGSALGLNAVRLGDEQTTYGAGTRGARALLARLDTLPPGSLVMGPYEAVALTAARPSTTGERDFNRPELFVAFASDPECRAVVMSLGRNSLDQLRRAREHPRLRALLEADYTLERIGDYWLWMRTEGLQRPGP
jgi:hypothetical protein